MGISRRLPRHRDRQRRCPNGNRTMDTAVRRAVASRHADCWRSFPTWPRARPSRPTRLNCCSINPYPLQVHPGVGLRLCSSKLWRAARLQRDCQRWKRRCLLTRRTRSPAMRWPPPQFCGFAATRTAALHSSAGGLDSAAASFSAASQRLWDMVRKCFSPCCVFSGCCTLPAGHGGAPSQICRPQQVSPTSHT